jgi:predicted ATPase/DNA-binding winged helix-turn-helix (wHTH) protein
MPAIADQTAIAQGQTARPAGGLRTWHSEGFGVLDNSNTVLAFGPFRLFPAERRLERDGSSVRLGGRALDLLIVLINHAGEIVPNRTLLADVWRDVSVEESSLRFHIKNLRKVLGDTQSGSRYVTNIPGRGYCFAAHVNRIETAAANPVPAGTRIGTKSNLPTRAAALIGRSDSMGSVSRELSRRRIVTIAGPAGIGKTSLAIATAAKLRGSFDDAVLFVDLAPIADPSLVISVLASTLGLVLRADEPLAAIIEFLRDERVLIVLDNCEHVIEAVAGLADCILRETAAPHILITSREPLRIPGEHVHRLSPLECPPIKAAITADEAMGYAAVQLFVERATAGVAGFSLDDTSAPVVSEICRRLDGIPLAIELAAARVEFFGVASLATRLGDMFTILTQGRRFALPRHQTLRAMLDWGYNLLSPAEQTVLCRIAIFRATFTLDSALAIVVGPAVTVENAINAMANLVAKSLLNADSTGTTVLYRLLESTRLYASERLAAGGEGPEAARRHAEHHLALIETAPPNWHSDAGKQWLQLYAGRLDDIRAALDWSFSREGDLSIGFRLMANSIRLWLHFSLTLECVGRMERILPLLAEWPQPDAVTEMRLWTAFGYAIWYSARARDRLEATFSRALELANQVGDVSARLHARWGMWAIRRARGQYREALASAADYAALAATTGDRADAVLGDRILGLTHHYMGNQAEAGRALERVRAIVRQTGTATDTDFQLTSEAAVPALLARILWLQGFPDQAMAALQEAIDASRRAEHWFSLYYTVCLSGCPLTLWTGDLARTQAYLDMTVNSAANDRWKGCWALILRLRKGGTRERLVASFLEPRLDLSTAPKISLMASLPVIPVPQPDEDSSEAQWNLPEVLRVNAELLLWHGGEGAAAAAETQLHRSLNIARQQATLSWELRTATGLARLWQRGGRVAAARDLLAATVDRFTEGFDTTDIVIARRLIADWS